MILVKSSLNQLSDAVSWWKWVRFRSRVIHLACWAVGCLVECSVYLLKDTQRDMKDCGWSAHGLRDLGLENCVYHLWKAHIEQVKKQILFCFSWLGAKQTSDFSVILIHLKTVAFLGMWVAPEQSGRADEVLVSSPCCSVVWIPQVRIKFRPIFINTVLQIHFCDQNFLIGKKLYILLQLITKGTSPISLDCT